MTNSIRISAIVAVYKAENYLRRCIDSILCQTLKDFEILLIDDGSPDNSGYICDKYAETHPNVHVYHKENGGVSSARKLGLEHSKGEFVIHIDPDDWIESDMFEVLYTKAKNTSCDIVMSDFIFEYSNTQKYMSVLKQWGKNRSSLFHQMIKGSLCVSNCNKIVRRAIFVNNNISFPTGFNYWEDYYTSVLVHYYTDKVEYVSRAFYHVDRYSNSNSLSRSFNIDEIKCFQLFISDFEKRFGEKDPGAIRSAKLFAKSCAFSRLYHQLTPKQFKQLYPEINYLYILKHIKRNPIQYSHALAGIGLYKIACNIIRKNENLQ